MAYIVITLQIDSCIPDVKQYIEKRYERYLDYAKFHTSQAGIPDEAIDVLNEVLLNLLQKDAEVLERLYSSKKGQYTQLDWYVLQSIKLNCHSQTSPYQFRYKKDRFENINLSRLKIIDEQPADEVDSPALTLKQFRLIRWVFNGLELSELERAVFEFRFIQGQPIAIWPGLEKKRQVYEIFNSVISIVHALLYALELTEVLPKRKLTNRQNEIATRFLKTHKVLINNKLKIN